MMFRRRVTRVEFMDPFADARRTSGLMIGDFAGEQIPMLLRHRDVRAAAKDTAIFSSNAPFRVPIPSEESVRSVRQLPIETDPPLHTAYRAIVSPLFMRAAGAAYLRQIEPLVADAVLKIGGGGPVDVVSEFSLPLQCRALAVLLDMPATEGEKWIQWGDHIFKDRGSLDPEKGRTFETYLDDAFERAHSFPEGNFFSLLLSARFADRRLTRVERLGFANLAFAGGRDTVINALSGAVILFGQRPDLLQQLREQPSLIASAVEELVRFLSPITHLGRVCPEGASIEGAEVAPGERVALCWASANRDETVFERADEFVIARNPNPHVGFGSGSHNCLGSAHARALLRTLLRKLAHADYDIEVLEVHPSLKVWPHYTRQVGYDKAIIRTRSR